MPNEYLAFRHTFVEMLPKFEYKWNAQLRSVNAILPRVELEQSNEGPIHLTLYRAGLKAREFQKKELENSLAMDVIEPS